MRLSDEQIGAELRALRETPSETFAAELDAWAASGFPSVQDLKRADASAALIRQPGLGGAFRRLVARVGRRPLLAGMAGAVTIVLVVAVSVVGSLDSMERTSFDGAVQEKLSAEPPPDTGAESGAAPSGVEPQIAPAPIGPPVPPPTDQLNPGRERVQERSASLSLSTEARDVEEVSDGVIDVTDRYDGIVASSQVSTADGRGRATFDLRIPTRNLQAALADLSDLAHVASRNEGTFDITAPFVTAEERFTDAKVEVDSLLDQLADAGSPTEIAAIREQLRLARGELAAARAELGALKQRADFSRLDVTVAGDGNGDGSWSIGEAADDAVNVLEAIGGAALIALAVLVPIGALTVIGWAGSRELRRRRREAPLDRD